MTKELEQARLAAAIESTKRIEANERAFKAEQEVAKLRAVLRDMATGSVTSEGLGTDPPADALACLERTAELEREISQLRGLLPDMPEIEERQRKRMKDHEERLRLVSVGFAAAAWMKTLDIKGIMQLEEDCDALLTALRTERVRSEQLKNGWGETETQRARLVEEAVRLARELEDKTAESSLRYDCMRGPGTTEPACGVCVTCLHHELGNAQSAAQLAQAELAAWRAVGGNQSPEFWASHLSKQVLESAQKDGQIERLQRELAAERRVCDGLFDDGKLLHIEKTVRMALSGQPEPMDCFMALLAAFKNNQRDVIEVNRTFNLQRSRMAAAVRLWQKATGRTDTWPDLGDLLAWLMKRAGKERKVADLLGKLHRTYRAILFPSEREAGQDNIAVRVQADGLERELGKLYGFNEAQAIYEDNAKIDVICQKFKEIRDRLLDDSDSKEEDGDYEEAEEMEHGLGIWAEAIRIIEQVKRSGCAEKEVTS